MPANARENPVVSGNAGKDLVNKDGSVTKLIEWATQNITSPEEMLDYFAENDIGVESQATAGDYVLVSGDEKAEWCSKHEGSRLMVVYWHFYENKEPRRDENNEIIVDDNGAPVFGEFVAMHIISRAGKFILNDSAKIGMYAQLRKETDVREEKDPTSADRRTSTAGLMVPGGLARNKPSFYDTRTNRTIRQSELNDTEKHPLAFRAQSKDTWKFNL
jgi:hypothetical protein